MSAKNLYQKIWDAHTIKNISDQLSLLYVDLHLIHEVTSPQAFDGIAVNKRSVRQKGKTFATMDHNVPTWHRETIKDAISKAQIDALQENCKKHNISLYDLRSIHQGIVHVIAPEQGMTQPGMVIVCGDSHTSTHGAFGALAFGIGTSEVEHVLATQSLSQYRAKSMQVNFKGKLKYGAYAKDMILSLIGKIGTGGGAGYVIEYSGEAVRDLSMEGRMTLCNMSIEGGARAGLVAPDQKTFDYLQGRPFAPKKEYWEKAVSYWESLASDQEASYDRVVVIDVNQMVPQVTWGTNPSQVVPIDGQVPTPDSFQTAEEQESCRKALQYMGLKGGEKMANIPVDCVFIGSCTNGRIEDLRIVAKVVEGKKVNPKVRAMVVPGSGNVRLQAEKEGLDKILKEAGFEWREAGCSMCLGMNEDILKPGERCASTSNRNFEGRQGKGGRTHLTSPAIAAVTAIQGRFTDIREW